MDVKTSLLTVLILVCIDTARADYIPIARYTDITNSLNAMTREDACVQLDKIKQKVEGLMTDSGLVPASPGVFCQDENSYSNFCSILDGSKSAPMVGSITPDVCSSYVKIKSCYVKECGVSGEKFHLTNGFAEPVFVMGELPCPQKATRDCVEPVKYVSKVTQDTCIPVARALGCLRDRLNDCGGSSQEQLGVDIAQSGLEQHVQHCVEKKYSIIGDENISSASSEGMKPNYTVVLREYSKDDYVPFYKYVNIGSLLNSITLQNGCLQLLEIKQKMEDVLTDSGLRPDSSKPFCDNEEPYPYCSMLTLAKGSPMSGGEPDSLCSTYQKIKTCYERECSPGGKRFDSRNSRTGTLLEDSCPIKATRDCIQPVAKVSKINDETCIAMEKAKMCFIQKLSYCGGFDEEQFAADVTVSGILHHVQHCKEDDKTLNPVGELCVADPLGTFFPSGYKEQLMKGPATDTKEDRDAFLKENCPTVEHIGTQLDDFAKKCDIQRHMENYIQEAINQLLAPRLLCMKEGYNLPDCQNSGIKCQARNVTTILTIAFISVITRLFHLSG